MRMITTVAVAVVAAASSACTSQPTPNRAPEESARPAAIASAVFEPYQPGATAVTYDEQLVPAGADALVSSWRGQDGKTSVLLDVHGLVPNRAYGSHAHMNRCGPSPEDSGPHYQNNVDPVQPSVDPKYANPKNEIWLDFTTDARGSAHSLATEDWQFTDRHPGSVVIHADPTHTDPAGHAAQAGARVGCVDVDF